jgi:NAD(P)-dependent dehydrogenase (short-subunit alcohol dehydrogenase family)
MLEDLSASFGVDLGEQGVQPSRCHMAATVLVALVLAATWRPGSRSGQASTTSTSKSPSRTATFRPMPELAPGDQGGLAFDPRRSIRNLAAGVRAGHACLDVLVNNAPVLLPEGEVSVDGLELTFVTGVLGDHRLTSALCNALRAAPAGRIVNAPPGIALRRRR